MISYTFTLTLGIRWQKFKFYHNCRSGAQRVDCTIDQNVTSVIDHMWLNKPYLVLNVLYLEQKNFKKWTVIHHLHQHQ